MDGDDFGDPGDPRVYCEPSGVYNELDDDDCDDTRAAVNPDAEETCTTSYDDDCDGDTNDRDALSSLTFYADRDSDGTVTLATAATTAALGEFTTSWMTTTATTRAQR